MLKRLAALLYANEGKAVDCDAIHQCHHLLKENTGVFSSFRGNSALTIATLLSLSKDRSSRLSDTLTVYGLLKDVGLWASDYLVIAAYQIAAGAEPANYTHIAERTKEFYKGMKSNHWFYTGQDDYIFSAMLGLSDLEVGDGVARMENLYAVLKPGFIFTGNSVQTLTQVLLLGGDTSEVTQRVLSLKNDFRNVGLKMDREYTLPSLGVLALLPNSVDTIVSEVSSAHDFLREQKGLGAFSVTKQELLLYCAALVATKNAEDIKSGVLTATLSTSITNIIIAQQAAMAAAAASSSAAVASSSS